MLQVPYVNSHSVVIILTNYCSQSAYDKSTELRVQNRLSVE